MSGPPDPTKTFPRLGGERSFRRAHHAAGMRHRHGTRVGQRAYLRAVFSAKVGPQTSCDSETMDGPPVSSTRLRAGSPLAENLCLRVAWIHGIVTRMNEAVRRRLGRPGCAARAHARRNAGYGEPHSGSHVIQMLARSSPFPQRNKAHGCGVRAVRSPTPPDPQRAEVMNGSRNQQEIDHEAKRTEVGTAAAARIKHGG